MTVKSYILGFKVDEVPSTWQDCRGAKAGSSFRKWLPKYLYWYRVCFWHVSGSPVEEAVHNLWTGGTRLRHEANRKRIGETILQIQYVADKGEFDPFLPAGWQALSRCFEAIAQLTEGLNSIGRGLRHRPIPADLQPVCENVHRQVIEIAKALSDRRFMVADGRKLPFDPIHSMLSTSSVLHHIDDYGVTERSVSRHKPGGCIRSERMASRHGPIPPSAQSIISLRGRKSQRTPLCGPARPKAFAQAGFQDIRTRCLCGIPYRGVAPNCQADRRSRNVADAIMEATRISRLIGTFAATAGRKPQTGKV